MGESLLRWAGSKKKLLPMLVSATPSHRRRYIEPFVGSAALFTRLGEGLGVLGDLNQYLVTTYEVIRDHPRAVLNRVFTMSLEPDYCYERRSADANSLKELDQATCCGIPRMQHVPVVAADDAWREQGKI